MTCGIYKISRIGTDDSYIGQSVYIEKRWREHRSSLIKGNHHCIYLQRAWNKYGGASFLFEIIEEVDNNISLLVEAEQRWMNLCGIYNHFKTARSPLGFKHSEQSIANMRNRVRTPEHCKAISDAKIGKKASEEAKKRMSDERKSRGIVPPSQKGKKKSEEHRLKISSAMMGNKNTLGFKHTEEQLEKMRNSALKRLAAKNGGNLCCH